MAIVQENLGTFATVFDGFTDPIDSGRIGQRSLQKATVVIDDFRNRIASNLDKGVRTECYRIVRFPDYQSSFSKRIPWIRQTKTLPQSFESVHSCRRPFKRL
jgi:hypothetical protein